MNNRILLLPGFGEDTYCFNEIIPYIKGYQLIHIDYRPVLKEFIFPFISVKQFAIALIRHYKITSKDKLIGHSMGGYFSFQIREILENKICMISGFSDTKKTIHLFPRFSRFTQLTAITGLSKTEIVRNYMKSRVKDENYKSILDYTMRNFRYFTNIELGLMTEMLYEKGIPSKLPNPLRIHDRADRVIAPPDEPYHQVRGGHFCLNLFPEETIACMQEFLTN